MTDRTQLFYDEMADDYHLIFEDWQRSMDWQGQIVDGLILEELGEVGRSLHVLDCAAGIGTQAIGLAKRGYRVHATDLSPEAIKRAEQEARRQGVQITTAAVDMRELSKDIDEAFDVVVAFDNALPHLLTNADLELALINIRRLLKPGGLFMASIRDYDAVREERPTFTGQRVIGEGDQRRVTFQVWDWADDGERYTVNQFILVQAAAGWQTKHYSTEYRALTQASLSEMLAGTGFTHIHWDTQQFYQPVVLAHAG